jgi:pimeloyl-ACP methyl ester carboxylesterase
MVRSPRWSAQGLPEFLRAYFHVKSADRPQNRPHPLESWTAGELEKLPRYYVMDLDRGMAETVAGDAPSAAEVAACGWLPEDVLRVYAGEFARTGFQGGLQWYRCATEPTFQPELETYSGRTIDVPACFIGGQSDWGVYQNPGALQAMAATACRDFRGLHFVDRAGHWVQQEQPEAVGAVITEFLRQV